MSTIIPFPTNNNSQHADIDIVIDEELSKIPRSDQEKVRFELIKTIDSYDGYFTEWTLTVPENCSEEFKKQIYDIARREHARKMLMLKDIIKLKIKNLVAAYRYKV